MSKYVFRIKGEYRPGSPVAVGFIIQFRPVEKFLGIFPQGWKDMTNNQIVSLGGRGEYKGAYDCSNSLNSLTYTDFHVVKAEVANLKEIQDNGWVRYCYFDEEGKRIGSKRDEGTDLY